MLIRCMRRLTSRPLFDGPLSKSQAEDGISLRNSARLKASVASLSRKSRDELHKPICYNSPTCTLEKGLSTNNRSPATSSHGELPHKFLGLPCKAWKQVSSSNNGSVTRRTSSRHHETRRLGCGGGLCGGGWSYLN